MFQCEVINILLIETTVQSQKYKYSGYWYDLINPLHDQNDQIVYHMELRIIILTKIYLAHL